MSSKRKVKNHIHKLKRYKYSNDEEIYFCTLDCGFRIVTRQSLGMVVLCNRCDEPFPMNDYSIRLSKPHCTECHKFKGVAVTTADLGILAQPLPERRASEATLKRIDTDVTSLKERLSKSLEDVLHDSSDDLL